MHAWHYNISYSTIYLCNTRKKWVDSPKVRGENAFILTFAGVYVHFLGALVFRAPLGEIAEGQEEEKVTKVGFQTMEAVYTYLEKRDIYLKRQE